MPEGKEESKKQFEGIMPDEIYVDDVQYEKKHKSFSRNMEYFEAIQSIDKERYPFFLRLVTLFVGLLLFCWSVIIAIVELGVSFLAAIFLFKSESLNHYMKELWKILSRMSAFSLSLFVATLAPSFGLGILALYLMMRGENLEGSFMSQLIKSRLKKP